MSAFDNPAAFEDGALIERFRLVLRSLMSVPAERVSKAAINAWWLCEYNFLKLSTGGIRGTTEGVGFEPLGNIIPVITIPKNWPAIFAANPIMQVGSVVYSLSMANDDYHGKPMKRSGFLRRAYGLEVEYLQAILPADADRERLSDYHRQLLETYPHGWDSIPVGDRYEYRPVHNLGWITPTDGENTGNGAQQVHPGDQAG